MFKKLLFLTLIIGCPIAYCQEDESERIQLFNSKIEIQKDCSVLITETITVYANNELIEHGIYRDIPLQYDFQGGRTDVDFDLVEIKRDGKSEDYHTEKLDNGIRIYIGNADIYLNPGVYTYQIKYNVDHVLRFLSDVDEIYWNINGNGWRFFKIDSIHATVILPKGIPFKKFKAYTGKFGATGSAYTVSQDKNVLQFASTESFYDYEGMTIAASWEKNKLTYPSFVDNTLYWIKSHAVLLICLAGIVLMFIRNYRTWKKFGRDPKPGTIVPQYEAPEELSPAEIYKIINPRKNSPIAFTGQVIALATKGWISIEKTKTKGGNDVYYFRVSKATKKTLTRHENRLFNILFSNRDEIIFYEDKYNPLIYKAMLQMEYDIEKDHGEKYYLSNSHLKLKQYYPSLVIIALAITAMISFGGTLWVLFLFGTLTIIMNSIFSYLYEQPTSEGRKTMDNILGLKLFIQYADNDRIAFNNPPNMNFETFERNLPYAIVLDMSKIWERKFDPGMISTRMNTCHYWYSGTTATYGFSTMDFYSMSNVISSASVPPSSSSGGSFSGGGGGFSGGGGGGGGGGGW